MSFGGEARQFHHKLQGAGDRFCAKASVLVFDESPRGCEGESMPAP